jgi:hypothetical protein
MKYFAILCALLVACAASTGPQDQEPNYLGHYIGIELNDHPLDDIDAQFWFYKDGYCQSQLTIPGRYPVKEDCEYTTPDENGEFWLVFISVVRYPAKFSEDGQYFEFRAKQNRWEFEKLGPA